MLKWTAEFNAGDTRHICDLFSPELRYDYRGLPERGYAEICRGLHRRLNDKSTRHHYSFDISEILVSGDIAIVRLTWMVVVTPAESQELQRFKERGRDVFRRQADGSWRIIRFLAYKEP